MFEQKEIFLSIRAGTWKESRHCTAASEVWKWNCSEFFGIHECIIIYANLETTQEVIGR